MDLDLSPWLLASHAAIGALGYATGMMVMYRAIPHEKRRQHMPHRKFARLMRSGASRGFTLLIVLVLMVVALAVQNLVYQADERKHDRCISEWALGLTDTARAARRTTVYLESVDDERDRALDEALALAVKRGKNPKSVSEEDYKAAVKKYLAAAEALQTAQERARKIRANNPYPTLDC